MKNLRNFAKLFLVWVISVASLSATIAVYQLHDSVTVTEFIKVMIIYMVYSFFCSLPAFMFFSFLGMQVLRQNWTQWKKRRYLAGINYVDIIGTWLFVFGFGSPGFGHLLSQVIQFFPALVLLISSTLAIVFIPWGHPQENSTPQ
jgi:hypothetical protein